MSRKLTFIKMWRKEIQGTNHFRSDVVHFMLETLLEAYCSDTLCHFDICRYMSMELLSGDHQDLTKSDIFSLGATLYEICLGRPLPMNGEEWQAIRAGRLQHLPDTPYEMEMIIRECMNPTYSNRPSAAELLKRPQLLSEEQKQLMTERNKVFQAKLALAQQARSLKRAPPPPSGGGLVRRNTWSGGYF